MAVIDLRSVTLWVVDGSTPTTGAITGATTAAFPAVLPFTTSASSTITVGTFTAKVNVGQYVNFGGHMQFYEVLASTPTTGATSGLTIYPALLSAVTSGEAINVVGNGIYAKLGEGNLTYSEKRNLIYVRDRGYIDTMKVGDDEPIDVSLDFTWEFLRSAGVGFPPTIEEAVKQVGQAATWVSTSADPCEPYSVSVYLLDIPPCGTDAESIQLPEFRWTSLDHDLKGGKVSVKASCNALYAIIDHTTP
jgi:hypothetical protein